MYFKKFTPFVLSGVVAGFFVQIVQKIVPLFRQNTSIIQCAYAPPAIPNCDVIAEKYRIIANTQETNRQIIIHNKSPLRVIKFIFWLTDVCCVVIK